VKPVALALALVVAAPAVATAATTQERMVSIALAEAGRSVREVPAKSNTSRDIRRYHRAVPHARTNERWCTIFVSYVAREAGYPLGSVGQGVWNVRNLVLWGRSEGFTFRKGSRRPKPGDIALHGFGHAGIVVKVTRRGRVFTVDGNWSDTVRHQPEPPFSVDAYLRLPSTPRDAEGAEADAPA
jgi:hypothetical protein